VIDIAPGDRPERLETARLVLRKVEPGDAGAMVTLHADPDAVRHRPEGAAPPDEARLLFASWLDHWAEHGFGYWAITLSATADLIGFGGLQLAESAAGPYLNVFYRLFPNVWGRGYAPEMVVAAVGWARQTLPELPVTIITPTSNTAAIRVAAKLGFTEVRRAYFQGALSCFFELPPGWHDADMPITVRADLAGIADYVAGRKLPGAIILSSNELSGPPPAAIVAAITSAATEINRYPAMGADDLMDRTAAHIGVDRTRLAVGCGSVSLCQQLVQALCVDGDEVAFPWRSFEAYPIVTQIAGARKVPVPLTPEHRFDLEALLAAITDRTRLVFVANPNNPTGTALRTAELTDFLDRVPENVLVVLDEAYREFVTDPDVPDGLRIVAERDNVAVTRTFSKAYALAGARVGYLVASPEVAAGVRKVSIPFSVNRIAQAAGIAAMDAVEELRPRCAAVTV
jgi:histidinol-phosphate aminotransferase